MDARLFGPGSKVDRRPKIELVCAVTDTSRVCELYVITYLPSVHVTTSGEASPPTSARSIDALCSNDRQSRVVENPSRKRNGFSVMWLYPRCQVSPRRIANASLIATSSKASTGFSIPAHPVAPASSVSTMASVCPQAPPRLTTVRANIAGAQRACMTRVRTERSPAGATSGSSRATRSPLGARCGVARSSPRSTTVRGPSRRWTAQACPALARQELA